MDSNKNVIKWNLYNTSRLFVVIASTGILIAMLTLSLCRKYLWANSPSTAYIIAVAIQTITRLSLCSVFFVHRLTDITTSGWIWLYLLVDTILSGLSVATYATHNMLENYEFILYCINFALTVCLLIYCTFADQLLPENSNNNTDTDHDLWIKHIVCPKSGASYASRITYQWVNRLLLKGWLNKSLVFDDLWALSREDSSVYNYKRFLKQCLMIQFIEDPGAPQWHGYVYTVLLVIINVFASIVQAMFNEYIGATCLRIKSCLTSAVYRKSLVLSNSAKRRTPTGEIVNIMAIDCQRISEQAVNLITILSNPIQLIIAVYLLYQQLGVAAFAGIIYMFVSLILNVLVGLFTLQLNKQMMSIKDKRQNLMNEILNGIKVLKLYAWEEAFMGLVEKIRTKELDKFISIGQSITVYVVLSFTSPAIVQLITYCTYVAINKGDQLNQLNASKIFVSLALFNLISNSSNNNTNNIKPILHNINLKVIDGQFMAIVGSVGSGKSSLMSALFGDMDLIGSNGRVNVRPDISVAYVPQQAWILNCTVKENILFGKPMDQELYDRVLDTCALREDLLQLSDGDETEIGEKGVNLSGGQKQRVSLARAVYSGADLYLLDDPLSAVDSHVAKHIVRKVLDSRTGILSNKTRLLVTNQLFVLPDVDLIVVIKDGIITSVGTYDNLLENDCYFFDLIQQYLAESSSSSSDKIPDNINIDYYNIYMKYAKHLGSYCSMGYLLSIITYNGLQIGSSFWLTIFSNNIGGQPSPPPPSSSSSTSASVGSGMASDHYYYLAIFSAFIGCSIVTLTLSRLFIIYGICRASTRLHRQLLSSVMHSPMNYFDRTPIGRLMNRFGNDTDVLDRLLLFNINLESTTRSPIYSHFGQTLDGVSSIRAYGCTDRFVRESNRRVDINQMCLYPNVVANSWLKIWLTSLSNCLLFFAAMFAVLGKGSLTGSDIGLSLSYAMSLTIMLDQFIKGFSLLENNMVSVERIDEYCRLESESDWHRCDDDYPLADNWPDRGSVRFESYATRYRIGLDLVLNDIDVDIKPGEKIGIVGRTGAGKSSLTLALFRLIEPAMGRIVIDGIDIGRLGLHELRSRLTIIPQEPILFSGTIRFNLDPFGQFSDDHLWTVLEQLHLKEFVAASDRGLDWTVAESGDNMSVGQRQLICLARALLRNTRVLILDEATAAVDVETDALIQQTIRQEFRSSTVLTIAHRINTIMDSDRVLVLDNGRVADFAEPDVLLKNNLSIFYTLARDAGVI
ncbi:multidrug resistance-associated protein 1-like [Oppia nitens]|uniref:multidrug resistance-associated protein 1-like n=1 Tax=Oppia nitens TaxID=1686743 RepID=UPI0023DA320B|nr:multidrug resistance-associated protein 1-like [Oppia nitens]